jgi:hypothetical protein
MLKITAESKGNVQFRASTAAVESLGLKSFTAGSSFTKRGNLVVPTGRGWHWISRFDGNVIPILQDLEDLETAERAMVKPAKLA